MKTRNVLDYKFEYNLKVAKENWKSVSSKTLHSCDEKKTTSVLTERLSWLKIPLAFCSVISDANMSISTSRARYFFLTLYTFSFMDFVLEYSGQEVFKSLALSSNFLRATQETVTFYLKITAVFSEPNEKNIRFCWAMNMNYLKTPRYHRYLLYNFRNKHLPVHTYVRTIFLLLLFLEKSAWLSTFRGSRG